MSCNSVAPCFNLVYLVGNIVVFYSFIFYYFIIIFFNLVNSFFLSALRYGSLTELQFFSFEHFYLIRSVLEILCLLTTFTRLCLFVARYLLLKMAVKKQIFSISQITDIEQYIAFVFTHATETSKILKIKKTQFS